MTRWVPLLALAACSSGSQPDTHVGAPPAVLQPSAAPARTGRHSAAIELVAVSEDARTAVSQDARGGTRLWPTLDGTREPLVVQLGHASELAVGRTASGFVIAALDQAGGVELVAIDDLGAVTARTRLAPDPVVERMHIHGGQLLVLRADQTIHIIEPGGALRTRLVPPPGARILTVHANAGRALALVQHADRIKGIRIVGAEWGAITPPLEVVGRLEDQRVMDGGLSPSGTYVVIPTDLNTSVVDLATGAHQGAFVATGLQVQQQHRIDFVDDQTLFVSSVREGRWQELGVAEATHSNLGASPIVAGGRVISGMGDRLELRTSAARVTYLGYRVGALTHVRVSPEGATVSGGTPDVVMLDRALRPRDRLQLPTEPYPLVDMMSVDETHVLAAHALSASPTAGVSVSVIDVKNNVRVQAISGPVSRRALRYQAATGLLAFTDGTASYLVQRDRATAKFETWYRVDAEAADLYVLDPAKSGGAIAINIRTDAANNKTKVERIRASELVVGTPISARDTAVYRGSFVGLDASGTVYMADGDAIVVHEGARERLRIPHALRATGPAGDAIDGQLVESPPPVVATRVPPYVSARGDRIALLEPDRQRAALYDTDGMLRWAIEAPAIRAIGWMGDELVAHFDSGLAKLDLTDGHLVAPTCGWAFGLSDMQGVTPGEGDSICDAP